MKDKISQMLKIKGSLLYWALILIVYGAFLGLTKNYESLSFLYHIALLFFPLILVFCKKERLETLGFQRGDTKQGIFWLFIVLVFFIGGIYFRAFMMGKSVNLIFDFSSLFLIMVVLAPISEEIFHRGLLQTKLEKILGETWGMIFPAILFALIHVPKMLFAENYVSTSTPLPGTENHFITLSSFFAFGIMFGYIYQKTKSIYYSIGAHIFVNLILGIFLY
jgi:membrane protease YdiL (CAAX protease family)